jgi:hypothetical protein
VSTIAAIYRVGALWGRPIAILIAHLPIAIFICGLLPLLCIGLPLAPSRYSKVLLAIVEQLRAWSCTVVASAFEQVAHDGVSGRGQLAFQVEALSKDGQDAA